MENGESNGVGLGPHYVQIHYLLNGKKRKNRQENGRAQKKPKQAVAAGDARPCIPGSTAVPPPPWAVVVSGLAVTPFPE